MIFKTAAMVAVLLAGCASYEDEVRPPTDQELQETYARVIFGAISGAGESVATAPDPIAAAERARTAIGFVVAGLQGLADDGGQSSAGEVRRSLLLEGDVAAGLGDELDPGASGGDGQLSGPGGQLEG